MPRLKKEKPNFEAVQRVLYSYYLNGNRIAPVIGVSGTTARKRMQNPELFTLKDLDILSRHFGIPWNEITEALMH